MNGCKKAARRAVCLLLTVLLVLSSVAVVGAADTTPTELIGNGSLEQEVNATVYADDFSLSEHVEEVDLTLGDMTASNGQITLKKRDASTYYVDATNGNDTNDGLSADTAWKSLDKVNSVIFQPGDHILFKKGETWTGWLKPQGSGEAGNPIVIASYGDGEDKPCLMPGEDRILPYFNVATDVLRNKSYNNAITFYNQQYWEVRDLELYDPNYEENRPEAEMWEGGVYRRAINLMAEDAGDLYGFTIDNCTIHGFRGLNSNRGKSSGGIIITILSDPDDSTKRVPTGIHDITVTNCEMYNLGRSGFNFSSPWTTRRNENSHGDDWGSFDYGGYGDWYPCKNIYIANNIIHDIDGDGILIDGCENVLVEHNTVYRCLKFTRMAVGMFNWNSDYTVFQYNEVYDTCPSDKDPKGNTYDGQGIEIDALNRDTLVQYNYSHNNRGGSLMWCNINSERGFRGIYRYNIFENEGNIWGVVDWRPNHYDSAAYNNTFYIGKNTMSSKRWQIANSNGGNRAPNAKFVNNIFYSEDPIPFGSSLPGSTWSSNIFYNVTGAPSDNNNQTVTDGSTLLADPGCGGNGKINDLGGYMLTADSPAIDAGETVTIPAIWNELKSLFKEKFSSEIGDDRDYFGNEIADGSPDIGAAEYGKADNAGAVLEKMTDPALQQQKQELQAAIDAYQKDQSEENRKALEEACNQALRAVTAVKLMKQAEEELKNEVSLTVYTNLRDTHAACKEMIEVGTLAAVDKEKIAALKNALQALDTFRKNLKITAAFENGQLTLTASDDELEIRYTTDGNAVSVISPVYEEPVELPQKNIEIKAALYVGTTKMSDEFTFAWNGGNLATSASKVEATSATSYGGAAANAVDGNEKTYWQTDWGASKPAVLTLTFDKPVTFDQVDVIGYNYYSYYYTTKISVGYLNESGEWVEIGRDDAFYPELKKTFVLEEPITATQIRLTAEDWNNNSYIAEFQLSYSKSGTQVDLTALKDLLKQAEELKSTEKYQNADEATKAKIDETIKLVSAVAENENSDAASVEAAQNALLDAMNLIGGVTPAAARTVLAQQISEAKNLSATLTETEQADIKQLLDGAIEKAQTVYDEEQETLYYSQANELKSAVSHTKEAVKLLPVLAEAKAVLQSYHVETWEAAKQALDSLKSDIALAESNLADLSVSAEQLRTQIAKLKASTQVVKELFAGIAVTISIEDGTAVMKSSNEALTIRYTLDGNVPSAISTVYSEPVALPNRALTIKAAAFDGTSRLSEISVKTITGVNLALNKTATSSDADWGDNYRPGKAVDGDANTKWAPKSTTPELTVDLGQSYTICQISVQQDSNARSTAFELLVSEDGETWTQAYTTDAMQQNATYDFEAVSARFVKLKITEGRGDANICEFGVYAAPEAGEKADMAELNEQITAAEAVKNSEKYDSATEAMRRTLELYLQIAKDVAANENSDQQTVNKAATALRQASEAIENYEPQPGVVPVASIALNRGTLTLTKGKQATLHATVLPEDATDKRVTWTSSDETVAVVDENGCVTAVKTGKATITATTVDGGYAAACEVTVKPSGNTGVIIGGAIISGLGGDDVPFGDVSFRNYYYDAVKWAVEHGITSGTSSYAFSPDAACTRAQTVTFLWRAAGSPKASMQNNPFTDVHANDYFYDAVLWAVENGITNGTSKTTFSPDDTVTRAQVVTFLWRVEGQPAAADSGFTDVSANAYYAKAIDWAFACGITTGMNYGAFGPDAACTRAQIVTFLYRNGK